MNRSALNRARREAERFLDRASELQVAHDAHRAMQRDPGSPWQPDPVDGSKLTSTVRRASMDLTGHSQT